MLRQAFILPGRGASPSALTNAPGMGLIEVLPLSRLPVRVWVWVASLFACVAGVALGK